ncbi:MAG: leucyl aminopeptidase family protein [Pseudobacteriovorax sp.]|nr:leucyl aminopeptidase family protein [Pseudobacteriovorax sp.]
MARSTVKSKRSTSQPKHDFGLSLVKEGYLAAASRSNRLAKGARLYLVPDIDGMSALLEELKSEVVSWQIDQAVKKEVVRLVGESGPIYIARLPQVPERVAARNDGKLAPSEYSAARDCIGSLMAKIFGEPIKSLQFTAPDCSDEMVRGALVGIEMAAYTFKRSQTSLPSLKLSLLGVSKKLLDQSASQGVAINVARHLVNIPPNQLYPESFADLTKKLLSKLPSTTVTVWDEKKLKSEKLNLILAVGSASSRKPRLVKVQYRPVKPSSKNPVVTLVGKGITFDSGGLDIKPAASMRLMKKDMGGAAATLGGFYGLVAGGYRGPIDLYLPLAENAISGDAFRPSDVFETRCGKTVEIHNTDAEGRLVLADALQLAKEQSEKTPTKAILNMATLTGAIKVGLGVEMGGFMANEPFLGEKITTASQKTGDFMWEVPFFDSYRSTLKSQFADINHCASIPFGGSLTAGLFLLEFVEPAPFAHFDIYAWADKAKGGIREAGGSGQGVQCIMELVKSL